ncbi:MAG TPA: hypothetical protein VF018_08235 [Acidobacteriaceae bacterium]
MRPNGSFSTTSSAGILLAFLLTAGAARSLPCIACELATSYHAAVRVYDRARIWGTIVRWWIEPEYAPSVRDQQPGAKPDNVCEMRPISANAR